MLVVGIARLLQLPCRLLPLVLLLILLRLRHELVRPKL